MTYQQVREEVESLSVEMGVELTLGYIGNCSPSYNAERPNGYPFNYDDRLWMVWFPSMPRGLGESYSNNLPKVTLGETPELLALSPAELRRRIVERHEWLSDRWLEELRARA